MAEIVLKQRCATARGGAAEVHVLGAAVRDEEFVEQMELRFQRFSGDRGE